MRVMAGGEAEARWRDDVAASRGIIAKALRANNGKADHIFASLTIALMVASHRRGVAPLLKACALSTSAEGIEMMSPRVLAVYMALFLRAVEAPYMR